MDKRTLLKIKLKSLAEETRIIQKEEQKLKLPRMSNKHEPNNMPLTNKELSRRFRIERSLKRARMRSEPWYLENQRRREEMQRHRIDVVRFEARATHLAYGILRGRTRYEMERTFHPLTQNQEAALWSKVESMLQKCGPPEIRNEKLTRMNLLTAWIKNDRLLREPLKIVVTESIPTT